MIDEYAVDHQPTTDGSGEGQPLTLNQIEIDGPIAGQKNTIVNEDVTATEALDHLALADGLGDVEPHTLIVFEPEYLGAVDEDDVLIEGASPEVTPHAQQYVFGPSGIRTIAEHLKQLGLPVNGTAKLTPANIALYNHAGEIEETANVVHCGRRAKFDLLTRTGGTLLLTFSHRLLVMNKDGWWVAKEAGDIVVGDRILVQRSFDGPIGNASPYSLGALYVLGTIIADGYVGPVRVMVSNDDPVIQAAIMEYGPEIFGFNPLVYQKASSTGSIAYHFNSKKIVNEVYEHLGWVPAKAASKQLGSLIRSLDTEGVRAVLQGYMDCECTIDDKGCIVVSSASRRLLTEVKLVLLAHFGIIGVLRYLKVANYAANDYWNLTLSGQEAASYVEQIGFVSEIRQEQAKHWLEKKRNPNIDVIPGLGNLLAAIQGSSETNRAHVALIRDYKGDKPKAEVTYQRLERILNADWSDTPALDRLRQVHLARYFYDEVISVKEVASEPAFDFDMPDSHTYILNGFATRNSADRVVCSLALAA